MPSILKIVEILKYIYLRRYTSSQLKMGSYFRRSQHQELAPNSHHKVQLDNKWKRFLQPPSLFHPVPSYATSTHSITTLQKKMLIIPAFIHCWEKALMWKNIECCYKLNPVIVI